MIKTFHEINEDYLKFYESNNYQIVNEYKLTHPTFKTSFILSAGVLDIHKILSGEISRPFHKVITQPCFRYFDIQPATSFHLSYFKMGAALYFNRPSRIAVLSKAVDFLIDILNISKTKLWLTYFAGDLINGDYIDSDDEIIDAWIELGMKKDNTIAGNQYTNFWREGRNSGESRSGICGTSAELFYDRGIENSQNNHVCSGPYCQCNRFLEIGNIVFPEFSKKSDGLKRLKQNIAEAAIGLERLAMITEKVNQITDLSHINPLSNSLKTGKFLNDNLVHNLCDDIRSIFAILDECVRPSSKGRGHILRKLFRDLIVLFKDSKIENIQNVLKNACSIISKYPSILYKPKFTLSIEEIQEITQNEINLFYSVRNVTQ